MFALTVTNLQKTLILEVFRNEILAALSAYPAWQKYLNVEMIFFPELVISEIRINSA